MTSHRARTGRPGVPPGFRDAPGQNVWLAFLAVAFVVCAIGAAATARIDAIGWCIAFCAVALIAGLTAGMNKWLGHRHGSRSPAAR